MDVVQVRALLKTTLRRATRSRVLEGRGSRFGLYGILALYLLMGVVFGLLAFMGLDVFTYCMLMWSMTFFFSGMTMVAESSTLLFDPTENDIIAHRPISPRTLLFARALGLTGLALMLTLALNVVPMFTGLATRGVKPWFPIAYLATLLLLIPFSAAVVVFVYALLARHVSRRRFDSIITWAQVGTSALMIIFYQIMPRLMNRMEQFRIDVAHPLLLFMPPAWFAALTDLMMFRDPGPRNFALASVALISTPLLGWAALRYFAVGYARQVAALSEAQMSRAADTPASAARRRRGGPAIEDWLRFWLRNPVERGAFRLALVYLTRDRDMRMRVYPQMATFLVLVAISVFDPKTSAMAGPFITLFFAATLPASILMSLTLTPQYAAADVFRYAPIYGTSEIFHGMRKAILLFIVFPGLIVSAVALWFLIPNHHGMRLTLPGVLGLPTLSVLTGLLGSYVPLSMSPTALKQSANTLWMFLLGAAWIGLFAALASVADHFGLFWPLIALETIVLAFLHPLLLRDIRNRPLRGEDH